MQGIIIEIDSLKSRVFSDGVIYECDARGNVRKQSKPIVGDFVFFEKHDNTYIITSILERKNEIHRPKISNIDQAIIVSSLKEPELATYILNKYICLMEIKKIVPIILFTKKDLLTNEDQYILNIINNYKKMGYHVFTLDNNNPDKEELDKLEKLLMNKISVFSGQTGSGKSSTLNNFLEYENKVKTQEISKALNRGKHTTTNVKLYPLKNNILLADTPGFSSFELKDVEVEDLIYNVSFLKPYINKCKFINCKHINEKDCAIKKAVENDEIPKFIYGDYKKLFEEISSKRKAWK